MFARDSINIRQFRGQGFMTIGKYNANGELLFIADKDSKYVSVVSTLKNQLIGTYNGHNGVIWHLDITPDSKYMVTCSGDMTLIVWRVRNGEILNRINESGIPKYLSINDDLIAVVCDPISKRSKSYISVYSMNDLLNKNNKEKFKLEEQEGIRATTVNWLNSDTILVTYDNGTIKKINYKTNEIVQESKIHEDAIKFVYFSENKKEILTSSLDKTAKIIDVDTLSVLKTFSSGVPVNCAIFTPDQKYVIMGGGIEAMMVAKTSDNDLTTKIYQVSNEKLLYKITNHFGPLRYLDFNPNKTSFVTASQDGSVKIHFVDSLDKLTETDNYELFGLASIKDLHDLNLKSESIKIENVLNNKNKTNSDEKQNSKNSKNSKKSTKSYPIGHTLYKQEEKTSLYKINSRFDIEPKENSSVKVSNLPPDVEVKELWDIFEYCGKIEDNGIRLKQFANDNVAFVNYLNAESAKKAIEMWNKKKVGLCIITVEMTQSK